MSSKHFSGSIGISRTSSNRRDDYISIAIQDRISGVEFFSGEMSLEVFARCLTGCGAQEIAFELRSPDLVGKKHEHKTELVRFSSTSVALSKERSGLDSYDRSPSVDVVLAPFEIEGWEGTVSDLFNKHRRENGMQRVTFHRHVDAVTGKPVLK